MNRVNVGFGKEEKKVNPLKVLGVIALILLAFGLFVYIRDYDRYYYHFKKYYDPNYVEEVEEGTTDTSEEGEENTSQEGEQN